MSELEIISCGPATSIQDQGRPGWSRIGLPSAGAMDPRALETSNVLVGNEPGEAAIEMAFVGLTARFRGGPVELAVAGAEAMVEIDGRQLSANGSFLIEEGETLRIGAMKRGVYAMLAVGGGLAVPAVLGSRSLDARAAIGGFSGRALQAGDVLPLRAGAEWEARQRWRRSHSPRSAPAVPLDTASPIRVVLGPQEEAFTERGLQTLIGRPFWVSNGISRMAYRLEGPRIERRPDIEVISDGTLPGAIQVPPDGFPMVLMADRQTVGGYPKIATVIGADLGRLAQRRPGEQVTFVTVSAVEAREITRQWRLQKAIVNDFAPGSVDARQAALLMSGVADAVVDAADTETWDRRAAIRAIHSGER